jgi:hypothetical protein
MQALGWGRHGRETITFVVVSESWSSDNSTRIESLAQASMIAVFDELLSIGFERRFVELLHVTIHTKSFPAFSHLFRTNGDTARESDTCDQSYELVSINYTNMASSRLYTYTGLRFRAEFW